MHVGDLHATRPDWSMKHFFLHEVGQPGAGSHCALLSVTKKAGKAVKPATARPHHGAGDLGRI